MLPDEHFGETTIPPSQGDISDSQSDKSHKSNHSSFSHKVIKNRDLKERTAQLNIERRKKALEEEKEMEERRKATLVLQQHGVSYEVANKAARRASMVRL